MFDVAPTELIVLGTVALLVIPPKDLPRAMRMAGYWVGRARGVARQFRSGFDNIVREAELEEMEKRWRSENERIMREHPPTRPLDEEAAGPATVAQPALVDHAPAAEPLPPRAEMDPVSVEHPAVVASAPGVHPTVEIEGKATS